MSGAAASVASVHRSADHRVTKPAVDAVTLVEGLGVDGDCHFGATVQHLSRIRRDPSQPNLRQVHLIHAELLDELAAVGYRVAAGEFGENLSTRGLDVLALPTGTRLLVGPEAVLEVTGLRNPCRQIDGIRPGLLKQVLRRAPGGRVERLAGVMAVVVRGGVVRAGDRIEVVAAEPGARPLEPV